MANVKRTKGELKRQRDALRRYGRYLPILQLKKQQLQMEILKEISRLDERRKKEADYRKSIDVWIGLLSDPGIDLKPWVKPESVIIDSKNIAGVDIPIFVKAEFADAEYDLFEVPLWVDFAVESFRVFVTLKEEMAVIEKSINRLRQELRITTQRVNLFEKVKIPEAEEAIRIIKIYIGDQMANAVGRSKIAKRKIEEAMPEGAAV